MSGTQPTALDAAVVCLRVMRRLLQDEEVTLAQLHYLVENIHDPLAQACLPPSQRPIVPALAPSTPQPMSRSGAGRLGHHGSSASHRSLSFTVAEQAKGEVRQPPQPAVMSAAVKPSAAAAAAAAPAAAPHKKASRAPAAPLPLTFGQYWDLFANLPTLYAVHMALVQQLEGIIQRLLFMVEELQPVRDSAEGAAGGEDGGAAASSLSLLPPPPPPATAGATSSSSPDPHAAGSGSARKHLSALRFPTVTTLGSAPGARGVVGEIGVMMHDFFGSELMKQYMAEHMMYAVKYTQRAAPQLLRLSRVWRWIGAGPDGGSAAVAALADGDRTLLLQHRLFLDFLWRSFGPGGVPQDSRVTRLTPLEPRKGVVQANPFTASDSVASKGGSGSNNNSGGGGGANAMNGLGRKSKAAVSGTNNNTASAAATITVVGGSGGGRVALPPIPVMWEGFWTILSLLATPLGGLRRYSHVARCLVESGALLPRDRVRLQESFIDVVALRMSEETNLVMEELWTHDVAGIMALMDMPGSRSGSAPAASAAGEKALLQPASRRTPGGGGGGAAGGGQQQGGHNGHSVAQDSVASTGGAVVMATGGGSGGGGVVSPASLATGASSAYLPSPDCSNRALIHYGRLSKRFGRGRHERLTFLFSDWMCYVEECSNGRFRVRGTIPLADLRVVEVRDEESSDAMHGFELLSPHLPKRLIFFTSSPEQRGQWVDAIRYTVRRFYEHHRPGPANKGTAATHSVTNASAIPPAVTVGETGQPSVLRATAPMLSATSRLSRQRRYDGVWQSYVDTQRRTREANAPGSPLMPGASSASLAGAGGGLSGAVFASASSGGHSPPPPGSLSADLSRNSSFAGQRSGSSHRQLEYDVTPWPQHSSVHRRIRSQDLLLAHHQQQQLQQQNSGMLTGTPAPSPQSASPTHSSGQRLNASLSAGPDEVERTFPRPASLGDASTTLEAALAPSVPAMADEGRGTSTQLPTPLLLTPGGSPGRPVDHQRRSSSSMRPAFLESAGSNSNRVSTGISTPLRRPVSERFEAIKSVGSGSAVALQSPLRTGRRASSTSSFQVDASSRRASSSVLVTEQTLPRANTTAFVATAAALQEEKEESNAGGRVDDASSSPPPHLPSVGGAGSGEGGAGGHDAVVLEDSTSEVSEPVEGTEAVQTDKGRGEREKEAEEGMEGENEEDDDDGDDGGGDGAGQRRRHSPTLKPLYNDVLGVTTRHAEPEDEDEEEDASRHSTDAGSEQRSPSTSELDRLMAGSPQDGEGTDRAKETTAALLQSYDEDLGEDSSEAPADTPAPRATAQATPFALVSPISDHREEGGAPASAATGHPTAAATAAAGGPPPPSRQSTESKGFGEEVSLSVSGGDKLRRSGLLEKANEDEDTATAVVTAFRRHSSPARSVMSPLSPTPPEPPLPPPSTQNVAEGPQKGAAPSERSLSGTADDEPGLQRRRHVDPMASDEGGLHRSV